MSVAGSTHAYTIRTNPARAAALLEFSVAAVAYLAIVSSNARHKEIVTTNIALRSTSLKEAALFVTDPRELSFADACFQVTASA